MKKIILFIVVIAVSSYTNAQVGIGTNVPTTDLDVVARTGLAPNEFNGLTIPRIAVLPTVAAEIAPAGTLIYLTAVNGTNPIGFYFSTGTAYVNVASAASGAFVETAAPTVVATDRTANITRSGNISVGGTLNSGKLNVEVVSANTGADPTGLFVSNVNTGVANSDTHSAVFENRATNVGMKFGILNSVNGNGGGSRTGIRNTVTTNGSGSNAQSVIGIDNFTGAVDGTAPTSINYGIRSEIGLDTSNANTIGIQSIARGNDARQVFSGWFQGDRFAIRNEDASTGYNLTVETGAAGQVLTSNGATGTSWTTVDSNVNNEGILSVAAGGANDSQIVSTNGTNSTNVTIAGGNGISITESSNTVTVSNTVRPFSTVQMYTQHDGSGFSLSSTTGIDVNLTNAGLEPSLYNATGNIQVKMVARYRNNNTSAVNLQLRSTTSTTDAFPIINTSGWVYSTVFTYGNGETEVVATSDWMNFNAGTNAQDIKLNAWVGSNSINLRNVYLVVRSQ